MKSPWKVTSNIINGQKMYGVYRQLDIDQIDHSGNREYAGEFTLDRETALLLAEELNKKEG